MVALLSELDAMSSPRFHHSQKRTAAAHQEPPRRVDFFADNDASSSSSSAAPFYSSSASFSAPYFSSREKQRRLAVGIEKDARNPVTGYNDDALSDRLYSVSDMARDVYLDAFEKSHPRVSRKRQKHRVRHQQQQRLLLLPPHPPPPHLSSSSSSSCANPTDESDDFENVVGRGGKRENNTIEMYASGGGRSTAENWHDLMLYAISGVLLIFVLEHVFRMGVRYASLR